MRRALWLGMAGTLVIAGIGALELQDLVASQRASAARTERVCRAVAESRHAEALALSDPLPAADAAEADALIECRCWALRAQNRAEACTALLDDWLAPGAAGDTAWLPPATLVRPVIESRSSRGAGPAALALADRAIEAYPDNGHLLELWLASRGRVDGEAAAVAAYLDRLAERETAGIDHVARLVLAIHHERRGRADAALAALGDRPPPPGDPGMTAWFHHRAKSQAALGDLPGLQHTMLRWHEAGAGAAELNARYALALSMGGLIDPQRDILVLLGEALARADEIEDAVLVRWLERRLISHLIVEGRHAEALAVFDSASRAGPVLGISRAEILRSMALGTAEAGGAELRAPSGMIVFRLPGSEPTAGGQLVVSPDSSRPADAPYAVQPLTSAAAVTLERTLSSWPTRWIYRDAAGAVRASGAVWPAQGSEVVVEIAPRDAAAPVSHAVTGRLPADGRRRVFALILDCADWRIIEYLRGRGELPMLARLLETGRRAVLHSTPPLTAAAMQALVWPAREAHVSVLGWLHQLGLELGGLEALGVNPLGLLGAVLPRDASLFEVIGADSLAAANMLFSHGAIDAGHHAEVVGPRQQRRGLDVSHVLRPLEPEERASLAGIAARPTQLRQVERIAGEFDAANELAAGGDIDLLMLRVEALDLLTHSLFAELAEGGQDDGRGDLFDVYRYIDARVSELHARLDVDDVLVVMSDHGIRTAMEHAEDAFFVAAGAGIEPGRARGRPSLRGVPRQLADWLGVETDWPETGLADSRPEAQHARR